MTTLEDIKKKMIDYLSNIDEQNLKSFWSNFSTNEDFEYLVSGEWQSDEIDLDGGRDYILARSGIIPLVFDYMYNMLKISKNDYHDIMYNSTSLSDELNYMYDNNETDILEKSEKAFDKFLNETPVKELHNIVSKIKGNTLVVKYNIEMKPFLDEMENLEFLGNSILDNSPIYKVKIPSGFTIVDSIESLIYQK